MFDDSDEEIDEQQEKRSGSRLLVTGSSYTDDKNLVYNFCATLDKQYECPVCCNVLRFPVIFEGCGHRCCATCLPEILKVAPICPVDQKPFNRDTEVSVDKMFQREIDLLDVKCSNVDKGCTWYGQLKDLKLHLDDCRYKHVQCPKRCGTEVERASLRVHMVDECPKREITCDFCKIPILAEQEANHLGVCGKFLLPCPNGCKKGEVERGELQSHLENRCPKQEIPCPFYKAGCEYSDLRKNMHNHIKENPIQHLGMACDIVIDHERTLEEHDRLLQKHSEKVATLERQVDALEKLYGCQLVWKIDSWTEKMQDAKLGKKPTIFSPPFLTSRHGYKMAMSLCPYGDGRARGKFISIFVCILSGDYDALLSWPFQHRISFTLIDQCQDPAARRNVTYTIKPNVIRDNKAFLARPIGERNASFGAQRFVELDVMKTMDYIRDDCVFIKCTVDSEDMEKL